MIKIVAENYVKPDSKEEFLKVARKLIEETKKESGNISYKLCEDLKDACHLTFIEEWKDEEAIKGHNSSKHFTEYLPILAKYCEKPGAIVLYAEIE